MKTYIKPTTEEILVKVQPLMNASPVNKVTGLGDDVSVSTTEFAPNTQTVDSRRLDLWGEDDE